MYKYLESYIHIYISIYGVGKHWGQLCSLYISKASVLETLLTAQTRLVLQTATYRRQKRSTQTDTKTLTP